MRLLSTSIDWFSLAYPDSVFDPKGNVVNAYNKEAIEDFYNSYVASLKTYLDRNLAP
jgi:hypothetical protein